MENSYNRLKSGAWGLRVCGDKPSPGQTVEVTRRDGTVRRETVGKVVWSGPDKWHTGVTVHLCTIATADSSTTGAEDTTNTLCVECGSRRATTTAPDSSGIMGSVCGRCARLDPMERSYA